MKKTLTTGLFIYFITALNGCSSFSHSTANYQLPTHLIERNAPLIKLSSDQYRIAEGPVWDGHNFVYFTSIEDNQINRFNSQSGLIETVYANSKATNGLTLSADGRLWGCSQALGLIYSVNVDGSDFREEVVTFKQNRFNHPNDLVLDTVGGVYFTDPYWYSDGADPQPVKGVYYANEKGEVSLLIEDMDKPNGILLSQDGRYLYVVDMGNDDFHRYSVVSPGKVSNKITFATLKKSEHLKAEADGLTEDALGNVYVATRLGVQVFSPQGHFLGLIPVPEWVTNIAFYGQNKNQLFITTHNNIYTITMKVKGS